MNKSNLKEPLVRIVKRDNIKVKNIIRNNKKADKKFIRYKR